MKTLIVYDSVFGNTEQIALAMGNSLGSGESVVTLRVSEIRPEHLTGLGLLIVGSPTRAFKPIIAISNSCLVIEWKGINENMEKPPPHVLYYGGREDGVKK